MNSDVAIKVVSERLASYERQQIPLGRYRPAAVLLALVMEQGELHIMLTQRTHTVEHHKGEISFPGGGVDSTDPDARSAALREMWEEVGIPADKVEVLGVLDDVISISDYRVTPFVSVISDDAPSPIAEPGEVALILTVPLAHLLDPANHRTDLSFHPYRPIHFFQYGEHCIWGLTGGVIYHFLELVFDYDA